MHDNNKQKMAYVYSNHFRSLDNFFASFRLALLVTFGRPLFFSQIFPV